MTSSEDFSNSNGVAGKALPNLVSVEIYGRRKFVDLETAATIEKSIEDAGIEPSTGRCSMLLRTLLRSWYLATAGVLAAAIIVVFIAMFGMLDIPLSDAAFRAAVAVLTPVLALLFVWKAVHLDSALLGRDRGKNAATRSGLQIRPWDGELQELLEAWNRLEELMRRRVLEGASEAFPTFDLIRIIDRLLELYPLPDVSRDEILALLKLRNQVAHDRAGAGRHEVERGLREIRRVLRSLESCIAPNGRD